MAEVSEVKENREGVSETEDDVEDASGLCFWYCAEREGGGADR